jgi:FkbM family methyltransferase
VQASLKELVKFVLRRSNFWLIYSQKNKISGCNLFKDLKSLLKSESPICFDVGANEGQTIKLLQEIFKSPRIHAFEPSSEVFRKLQSRRYSSEVFLHHFALGRQNSQEEFLNYEDSRLSSFFRLSTAEENQFGHFKIKRKESVEIKTIDWFLKQNDIAKIDLLKIDTQGYDLQVLQGASESFRRGSIKNVYIELNFLKIYENQADAQHITRFLTEQNFYLVDYYEKSRQDDVLVWCNGLFTRR